MRILRVAPWLYPDTKGGGQYHVHAMSRDQAAMGHDVTVLTIRQDKSLPYTEEREGYTVVRYDSIASPLGNDIAPGLARYLASADGFDVIHAHSHYYVSSVLAAIKSIPSGIPLVITNHGLFSQSAPRYLQKLYIKSVGRWTFNQAERVFCYTKGEKRRLRSYGVHTDISVVSNGIDPDRFRPDGPRSDLIEGDGPVVLSVVRLVDGKRPLDAIQGVERIQSEFPNVHLFLLGDGYLKDELEEYVYHNDLESTVTFLDPVAYDHMPNLYRSTDILLLPSEEEAGTPRVVLEAMATEKPFVMADLEQTTDELDPAGETYPVGDIEELAEHLQRLISDHDRRFELGQRGRSLVQSEFNWGNTVEQTTEVIRKQMIKGG